MNTRPKYKVGSFVMCIGTNFPGSGSVFMISDVFSVETDPYISIKQTRWKLVSPESTGLVNAIQLENFYTAYTPSDEERAFFLMQLENYDLL